MPLSKYLCPEENQIYVFKNILSGVTALPVVSQKRPPEWIPNISKTNLVFFQKKTFLCRK